MMTANHSQHAPAKSAKPATAAGKAQAQSATVSHSPLVQRALQLQKAVGNQAMQRMIQRSVIQRKHEMLTPAGSQQDTVLKVLDDELGETLRKEKKDFGYTVGPENKQMTLKSLTSSSDGKMTRPDKAEAHIEKSTKGESRAKIINEYGWVGAMERAVFGRSSIQTYDGGHLIGHQFFGKAADVHGNLAPQLAEKNQQSFRFFEELVTKFRVGASTKMQEVKLTVDLSYPRQTFTRTLKQLHEAGVLDLSQYNALLKSGLDEGKQLTFPAFVPDTWKLKAEPVNSKAKAQDKLTADMGWNRNYVNTEADMQKSLLHDDSVDEDFEPSQSFHGYIPEMKLDENNELSMDHGSASAFYRQAYPLDTSIQPPALPSAYFTKDKRKDKSVPAQDKKKKRSKKQSNNRRVPLSGVVDLSSIKSDFTRGIKKPTQVRLNKKGLEKNDGTKRLLELGMSVKVLEQLVKKMMEKAPPSDPQAMKSYLESVWNKSGAKDSEKKSIFVNLYRDANFVTDASDMLTTSPPVASTSDLTSSQQTIVLDDDSEDDVSVSDSGISEEEQENMSDEDEDEHDRQEEDDDEEDDEDEVMTMTLSQSI
jgi:hypothetical protein